MRLIPNYLSESLRNSGERRFYDELKMSGLPQEYHAIHSLNLPEHQYKMFGELDFVIVSPRGLYVMEVKSGSVVCEDGCWTIGEGEYSYESEEGPFKQAESGMWSLLSRLERKMEGENLRELTIGYGVVFPDVPFDVDGFEWDQEIVLDFYAWRRLGVKGFLEQLENYWHRKQSRKPAVISTELVRKIVLTLRPQVERLRPLTLLAEEADRRFDRLTDEQYIILDAIGESPRLLIQGGAGTGKTLLALHSAELSANQNNKVLFVCFSPLLASYLRWKLPTKAVEFTSLYNFMTRIVYKYDKTGLPGYLPGRALSDPWFREVLAPAFEKAAEKMQNEDQYDVLIVDEAQDLLNLHSLIGLSAILRGGLDRGVWRMFYDAENQSSVFGAMDQEVMEMLTGFASVQPKLSKNRRNTNPILEQTKLVTGCNTADESNVDGPDVTMRFYRDRQHAAELLAERLNELLEKLAKPGDITILSPYPFEQSSTAMLPKKMQGRISVLDGTYEDIFPFPEITFATIADFKGLENRFILLIDLDDLDSTSEALSYLYVGMTRPRYHLWMAVANNKRARIQELIALNMEKSDFYG